MRQVSRYHPVLVMLHWLLAVLIVGAVALGFFGLAATPNTDPRKVVILEVHMAGGMLILALMVIRFIVRLWTARPVEATTGRPLLDRLASVSHWGFYVLVLVMVGTGYATGILAGLPAIVFGGSGDPLPRMAIWRRSWPASSWYMRWPRSITNSPGKTGCSSGCPSGVARLQRSEVVRAGLPLDSGRLMEQNRN
jgi:cytochrome b561